MKGRNPGSLSNCKHPRTESVDEFFLIFWSSLLFAEKKKRIVERISEINVLRANWHSITENLEKGTEYDARKVELNHSVARQLQV